MLRHAFVVLAGITLLSATLIPDDAFAARAARGGAVAVRGGAVGARGTKWLKPSDSGARCK
jgi:hypothetical protein